MEWKAGRLDVAADRYRYIQSLGRRSKSAELKARGLIGFVALSQIRQNAADMHRFAKRAAHLAEQVGLRRLTRDAHNGLAIAAGLDQRIDDALVHGWTVYQLSIGDALDEAEVLGNLGYMLFVSGFVDVAALHLRVWSRANFRPAGFSRSEIWRAVRVEARPHTSAARTAAGQPADGSRYDLALAPSEHDRLAHIGARASSLQDAALGVARQYGFLELVAKLERLDGSIPVLSPSPTTILNNAPQTLRVNCRRWSRGNAATYRACDRVGLAGGDGYCRRCVHRQPCTRCGSSPDRHRLRERR
jgi:hypothetical protein